MAAAFKPVASGLMAMGRNYRWMPTDESPLAAESAEDGTAWLTTSPEIQPPLEVFKQAVFVRWFGMVDYLSGLCKIAVHGGARGDIVAMSAAPIARAALEAVAYLHWYCEADVKPHVRVRRMCCDIVHQMHVRHKLDRYAQLEGLELDPGWDEFREMLEAWQVLHDAKRQAPKLHVLDGDGKQMNRPSAQEIMAPLMQSEQHTTVGAFFYADVSDVAHASLEGLLRRANVVHTEDDTSVHVQFSRDRQLGSVAILYWGLHQPVKAVMSLMGWEDDRFETVYEKGAERLSELGRRLHDMRL